MSNHFPDRGNFPGTTDQPTTRANAETAATFAQATAEMDAVFQEGMALESQGKLDAEATKRIEARLKEISDRLDKKLAADIAEIKARPQTRPQIGAWQKIAAALFLFGFFGMLFELTLGENFVFSYTNDYVLRMPLLFSLLLPALAIFWFRLERKNRSLADRYPTWWVRWLLMVPVLAITSSALVIFSPFGWSALAGWAIGAPSAPTDARVLSVAPYHRQAGKCDQKAKLAIDDIDANICLEGRVAGPMPKAGDMVSVVGRRSPLGLYIEEIRVK